MLLCYDDEQYWASVGTAAHRQAMNEAVEITHELDSKGQYRIAAPLHPVATAKSVRIRDGKRLVTDGPFVETREVLGGFYLIDVPDIESAIEIAARHPGALVGGVEIRPVIDLPGLPLAKL
jgi:hypothetical protein